MGVGDDVVGPIAVEAGVGDDKVVPSPRLALAAAVDEGAGDDDIRLETSPSASAGGGVTDAAAGEAGDEEDPDAPFLPPTIHKRLSSAGRLLRRRKKRPARLARVSYHLDRMHHS
jgi:hypothetical protein